MRSDDETLEEVESHGPMIFEEPSLPIPNFEGLICGICDVQEPEGDEGHIRDAR